VSSATSAPSSNDDVQPARRRRAFFSQLRSRRGAAVAALALTLIGAALPFPGLPAAAVHDVGLFELDANATDEAAPGQDWNTVSVPPASTTRFIEDGPAADTTYFTGGQSKDTSDVLAWKHADNSAPDKDEITNAYAAAYTQNNQTYVYYGLDRFDNSGSAFAGFWFFQNPVSVGPNGTFVGEHEVGDILIASNFTNGGQISTIQAFMWNPDDPNANDNLVALNLPGVTCGTALNDNLCAISNTGTVDAPWAYLSKDGATDFPTAAFFEGGINLSSIFGSSVPCFSTFMAETRSSSSVGSVLKDFALGQFAFCGLSVQKTGDTLSKVGDSVTYNITITNTGMARLYKDDIEDSLVGDMTINGVDQDTAIDYVSNCGQFLEPGASCTITYQRVITETDVSPVENTVNVNYNSSPELNGEGISFMVDDEHDVELFVPGVTVSKTGDALSTIGDPVDYVFTVTNTSSSNSPALINGTIVDNVLGDLLDPANPFVTGSTCTATLGAGASCTITATRIVQAGDADPLPNTVNVTYNPQGFPNLVQATDDHSVNLFQPSVLVEKTGSAQSKVGDTVDYTIRITNTSSEDTPTLLLDSITDPLIPNLTIPASCQALAPNASCEIQASRVVQANDPNPLINTVTVVYHADTFPADVAGTSSTDNHSTDLFVPSVRVDKGGPATAKVGDSVTYTFKVTNTSTPGSPALILDSITDPLIGTLTIPASCNSLAVGVSCNFTASRTVLANDPDPLVNTVTVHYHPVGFPNDIVDTDDHRIDIVTPPTYGQDPDDDDAPEDPYDISGGNGPTLGDTAGDTDQTGTPAPATPEPVVENNVVENAPAPAPAPVSLDQLPRTGLGLDRLTAIGALLLILGGISLASRRRRPNQA
jgi:hypothetical protein